MEHLIPQTKHNQSEPLLEQIDWVFTSVNWISVYPNTLLLPMARPTSEHIPCKIQIGPFLKPKFSDEIFWIEHPVFFILLDPTDKWINWTHRVLASRSSSILLNGVLAVTFTASAMSNKVTLCLPCYLSLRLISCNASSTKGSKMAFLSSPFPHMI